MIQLKRPSRLNTFAPQDGGGLMVRREAKPSLEP
jgi:hypothetical protein